MDAVDNTAGQYSFASYLQPAWHRFGQVFDEPVDTPTMLQEAHLDNWNLRQIPHDEYERNGIPMRGAAVEGKLFNVRDNPADGLEDIIGIVTERYRLVPNEELFEFAQGILDEGGQWETAGALKGGRIVFASLSLPGEIVIDPQGSNDKIWQYIMMHSAHDGSAKVSYRPTDIRPVCWNTVTMALRQKKNVFSVKHTDSLDGKIAAAREALQITYRYNDALEAELNSLFQADMNSGTFQDLIAANYPESDTKTGKTRRENTLATFEALFNGDLDGAPDTVSGLPANAYRGLQAVTAYFDHHAVTRGDGEARDMQRMGLIDNQARNAIIGQLQEYAAA